MSEPVAGAEPGAQEAAQQLHRKLVWLTFFRVVSITVLLGGSAAVSWKSEAGLLAVMPLYRLVIVTYLASIGCALWLRSRRGLRLLAHLQIGLDVAISA